MKKHILLLISISLVFLLACGKGMGETELKKEDKSPESLNDVSSGIDEVVSSLDEIERLVLNIPSDSQENMEENDEEVDASKQEDKELPEAEVSSESGESSGSEGESESSEESDEELKDRKIEETWLEIEKNIEEIYGIWNEYEVEGQI